MQVLHVVGARPNFMKAAPVTRALGAYADVRQTLVHTGQHYDRAMSEVFLSQLEMPTVDVNLGVGSGTHAQQTAAVMVAIERVLVEKGPDIVVVYGDVNSTLAASLVCSKLGIAVAHVEAGLRSGDRTMPEEINRLLTDQVSSLLFTPSADADDNLRREGGESSRVHLVGNVMIDTLIRLLPQTEEHFDKEIPGPFALITLHRPSNVDDLPWLLRLLETLVELSKPVTIVFPVHPRTRERIRELGRNFEANERIRLCDPLPYIEFIALERRAAMVITDSGGIQEETTFLGVPCLTVRENTERPITISVGTNQLVGRDPSRLKTAVEETLKKSGHQGIDARRIPLWDGHAAERIAQIIVRGRAG